MDPGGSLNSPACNTCIFIQIFIFLGYIMTSFVEKEDRESNNSRKFSPCSLEAMKTNVLMKIGTDIDDCFQSLRFNSESEPEISICGNMILEPGEECDCGRNASTCYDPCCYPAYVSENDRYYNRTAVPCTYRRMCSLDPALVYGIYLPFSVIIFSVIIVAMVLHQDWKRNKWCFTHITQGNIRILR